MRVDVDNQVYAQIEALAADRAVTIEAIVEDALLHWLETDGEIVVGPVQSG